MTSPIAQAWAITPRWMQEVGRYDAVEVWPVRDLFWDEAAEGPRPFHGDPQRETRCEPCAPHEAQFWSVYGRLKSGELECFDDFATEAKAEAFAQRLREA